MGQPFIKFYSSDWRTDPELRMCSPSSRGVWIDCISIMMEAEPYGHLCINSAPAKPEQIAALTCTPVKVIKKALAELLENGVASQTDNGVIYSRRLVRDRQKQEQARNFGHQGGNPKLRNQDKGGHKAPLKGGGYPAGDKGEANPHGKPESRYQNPDTRYQTDEVGLGWLEEACEAAGMPRGAAVNETGRGQSWLTLGLRPEQIVETIRTTAMQRGLQPGKVSSLAYFDKPIRESASEAKANAVTPEGMQASRDGYVALFKGGRPWNRNLGPAPGEPGCLCSPEVLRKHGFEVQP